MATIKYVAGPSCVEYLMRRYSVSREVAVYTLKLHDGNVVHAGALLKGVTNEN